MDEKVTVPAKPLKGASCNGCGMCCRMERCGFAVEFIGAGPGACPALEYDDGRAWCGLLRHPAKHLGLPDWFSGSEFEADMQRRFAYGLAIGAGCDSEDL